MQTQQLTIRDQQKNSWNTFSPGWRKWDDFTMHFLQSQGDQIIKALDLKANHKVLDIAAGTAVRFEPGQTREVTLVNYAGSREVYGFRGDVMGSLDKGAKS